MRGQSYRQAIGVAGPMLRVSFLMRHAANFCAPGLVILSLFFGFVRFHDYPVWTPEVMLVAAAILVLGIPLGLLLSVRAKTLGAGVVTLLLLAWSCETLISAVPDALNGWQSIKAQLADLIGTIGLYVVISVASLLVVAMLLILTGLLGDNLGLVVTTVFGVATLCVLILPTNTVFFGEYYADKSAEQADLPPIIHLVLDEHIGIEGLPGDIEGADLLREELRSFYADFGFRLFGRAYSQYHNTKLSLAAMLRGEPNRYVLTEQEAQAIEGSLRHNAWFQRLAQRGYRVRVYSSFDVNFCDRNRGYVRSCYAYEANSIASLKEVDLPTLTLAKAISAGFLDSLVVYQVWAGSSRRVVRQGIILPSWMRQEHKYAAPASLPIFRRILQDLKREPRGSAYFAHLLIPHHTYMYDEHCRIKPNIEDWSNNVSPDTIGSLGIINTPESRKRFYANYFEQLRCTRRALQDFLEKLQKMGVYETATIIIQGDHGSRIALAAPNRLYGDLLSDTDLVDLYSTLFAVHGPGFDSGYDTSLRSVQALFAEMILEQPLMQEPNRVVLNSSIDVERNDDIEPWMLVPMPAFGSPNPEISEGNDDASMATN
jgi:hypothetical protein